MTKSQGVTFPHAYLKITEKKKEIYKYKIETEYPWKIQNLQQEVVNMQKALLIDENRSMYEDLWDRMTSNERIAFAEPDIDDSKGPDETKAMLRRTLLVEPSPFVKRVVFISTPHRGSFRSSTWLRKIMRRLIKLPADIVQIPFDMYDYVRDDLKNQVSGKIPTSLDTMSTDSPLLKTLADISLAPGVKGHSIIAVKNPKDPREQWNDGVVEYKSAHLEGMESEFILETGHSCQGHPLTIEEVRRILLEHLKELP